MIEQFMAWLREQQRKMLTESTFGTDAEIMHSMGRQVAFMAAREWITWRRSISRDETDEQIIEMLCKGQSIVVYMGGTDFTRGTKDAMSEIHAWHVEHFA